MLSHRTISNSHSPYPTPSIDIESTEYPTSCSSTGTSASNSIPISPATMSGHLNDSNGPHNHHSHGGETPSYWRTNYSYPFHLDTQVLNHEYPVPFTHGQHPHPHSHQLSSPSCAPQVSYDTVWPTMSMGPVTPTSQSPNLFERPTSSHQVHSYGNSHTQSHTQGRPNHLGLVFADNNHGSFLHSPLSPSRSPHLTDERQGRGINPPMAFSYTQPLLYHHASYPPPHPSVSQRPIAGMTDGHSKPLSIHLSLPTHAASHPNTPPTPAHAHAPGSQNLSGGPVSPPIPLTAITSEAVRLSEEAAYLARQDTKERPPPHLIERERAAVDWKSLRFTGNHDEVIEELMRMTTKNLKNPGDIPKRPMNGFMIFTSNRRPQIAKNNPKNGNGENSKILAREWTWYMPDGEKQYWQDLADDYRDEFKRRFPSFQYRRLPPATPIMPGGRVPSSSASSSSGMNLAVGGKKRRYSDPLEDEPPSRNVRPSAGPRTQSAMSFMEIKNGQEINVLKAQRGPTYALGGVGGGSTMGTGGLSMGVDLSPNAAGMMPRNTQNMVTADWKYSDVRAGHGNHMGGLINGHYVAR